MIDIQIYKDEKKLFYRQNLDWNEVHGWLYEKEEKGQEINMIDIQLFSDADMPITDIQNLTTFKEAHDWINETYQHLKDGDYNKILGIYEEKME